MDHRTGTHRQNQTPAHVRVPAALLYGPVSRPAQHLWAVLDDLARSRPSVVVSTPQLAAVLGLSDRQVRRLAIELQVGGWLVITGSAGRGRQRTWYPQNRARPVDNDADGRTVMSGYLRSQPDADVRLSPLAHIGTAHTKKEEPGCARCDRGWVERDGRVARCACSRPPSPF